MCGGRGWGGGSSVFTDTCFLPLLETTGNSSLYIPVWDHVSLQNQPTKLLIIWSPLYICIMKSWFNSLYWCVHWCEIKILPHTHIYILIIYLLIIYIHLGNFFLLIIKVLLADITIFIYFSNIEYFYHVWLYCYFYLSKGPEYFLHRCKLHLNLLLSWLPVWLFMSMSIPALYSTGASPILGDLKFNSRGILGEILCI